MLGNLGIENWFQPKVLICCSALKAIFQKFVLEISENRFFKVRELEKSSINIDANLNFGIQVEGLKPVIC